MQNKSFRVLLIAASLCAPLASWAQTPEPTGRPTQPTQQATPMSLTDNQIAGIIGVVNAGDMENAKLAEKKTKNKDVRNFAMEMQKDHMMAQRQLDDIMRMDNMSAEETEVSKSLKQTNDTNMTQLKKMNGMAFDRMYIDNEITLHQVALEAIDKTLMPSAQNPNMKSYLEKIRPIIEGHLQHAQQIKQMMPQEKQ